MFSRSGSDSLRSLLLAVAAVALLVADQHHYPYLVAARQWVSLGLQPLIWVISLPGRVGGGMGDELQGHQSLATENRQLRLQILVQNGELLRLHAIEAENLRIRALLASSSALHDRVSIAEVLQVSQDPYRHQILVNKGSMEGVYKGQALVDSFGVLGQIIQVNPDSSVALLIDDPDHGIPVEVNRTGLQTIAVGRGDSQALALPYLPGNADVKVGDLLVSSALGSRFPAGYPVGQVYQVHRPPGQNFIEALAYPSAHLNQGRQVLLVWSHNPVDVHPQQMLPIPAHVTAHAPKAGPPSRAAPHR
jgi:rod shape-determining protein MreC